MNVMNLNDPCVMIVLDAGPWNTFAAIDRLDLLLLPKTEIVMVDVILWETTAGMDKYEKDYRIAEFVKNNSVSIKKTDVGFDLDSKLNQRLPIRNKHIGEIAIANFLAN